MHTYIHVYIYMGNSGRYGLTSQSIFYTCIYNALNIR